MTSDITPPNDPAAALVPVGARLPAVDREVRLKRLRWRAAHRGFLEADLVLGGFAETEADRLDPDLLDAFERLLEENDHDVYGWILGRGEAPAPYSGALIARLRAHLPRVHQTLGR